MPGHTAHSKPGVPLHACECEAPAHPNWERRSNEEWLRPFVPHGLADFTYSLTRRWEGHIQWVARYFPKDPDKHPLSGEVPQKYRAKSMTPSPRLTEHSAFRAALDFLWGRHKLWHPECTVPTIVQEAMAANNCCTSRAGVLQHARCQWMHYEQQAWQIALRGAQGKLPEAWGPSTRSPSIGMEIVSPLQQLLA